MKPDSTHHSRWPIILAILTAVIGIGLSLYARSRVAQVDATKAQLTAETLRLNTEQELELFGEVLESTPLILTFRAASYNQAIIDEFVKKGMPLQHAVLSSFGLAQRINLQIRIREEEKEKNQQGSGYRVVHRGPGDTWVSAPSQPYYYPLFFQSRHGALHIPVGFDFISIPEVHRIIQQIENSHRTTAVPSPTFFSTESDTPTYWVFAPFNNPYEPQSEIIGGVAVAILNPESILNRISSRSLQSPDLQMTFRPTHSEQNNEETVRLVDGRWLYQYPMKALETNWLFECSLPASISERRSTAALVFGLIITALMTSQLLVLGGRTRKIEAEVLARTEDLRVANIRLEENLHDRASLEEEMNELAARERRRIGRDLHDSLGQKLTGAVFLSRSLMDYLENKGITNIEQKISNAEGHKAEDSTSCISNPASRISTQQTHAKTLNETLKSAVSQVRNMARGLAPVALNDESLGEALDQLAEEMTGLYGVSCEVSNYDNLPSLSRRTKEQLYLISREAVNNAARHAQAERITVRLTGDNSNWKLSIEDDGKGLPEPQSSVLGPPSSAFSEGMGIRIMRHRASLIGAKFAIHSTPDQGTCITVKSPEGSG